MGAALKGPEPMVAQVQRQLSMGGLCMWSRWLPTRAAFTGPGTDGCPCPKNERKVYAGQRPRALRKGPLTSRLERASPRVPPNYTSYGCTH
eukprot:1160803-Pelagomonas_calceolata.AAC.19